ncbi:MAG TPA: tetratricopeptide repeat protein [Longimicrobiales bacterium]
MSIRLHTTRILLTILAASLAAMPVTAQTTSHEDAVARAADFFQKGDWPATADAYGALIRVDSANGMAWFRLGIANHALGRLEEAKVAYARAIALKTNAGAAAFRIARIHALTGQADSAIAVLDGLSKNGFVQSALVTQQPDFAAIKDDARLKAIVATMDAKRFPCRTRPESRQFDFWEGSWNVFVGGQQVGTNIVTSLLGNCALQENWTDAQGGEGRSMNYFDPNTGKWRQIWVADNGGVLDYVGAFTDGAMRFTGVTVDAKGNRTLQKLTFFPIARDSVRQLFEASTDDGKTWTAGFDGMYVRQKK